MSTEQRNDYTNTNYTKLGKVYGVIKDSDFPAALVEVEKEGKDPQYRIMTLMPDQSAIYWNGNSSPSLNDFELTRLHHIISERLAAMEGPGREIKGISSHHMGPDRTDKFDINEHWGMVNSNRYEGARLEVNMVTFHSFENEEGQTIPESTKLEIREWRDGLPKMGYRFSSIDEVLNLKKACEVVMKEKGLSYEREAKNKIEKSPMKGQSQSKNREGPER